MPESLILMLVVALGIGGLYCHYQVPAAKQKVAQLHRELDNRYPNGMWAFEDVLLMYKLTMRMLALSLAAVLGVLGAFASLAWFALSLPENFEVLSILLLVDAGIGILTWLWYAYVWIGEWHSVSALSKAKYWLKLKSAKRAGDYSPWIKVNF